MNEYKSLRIKEDTHQRTKIAAAKAGMTLDEYQKYLLNLGAAYPPTVDYQAKEDQS